MVHIICEHISKKLEARFYKLPSGKEPVKEWIKDLDKESRRDIGIDIKTVEFGWPIGMPVCRPLGPGLYEVRSRLKNGTISRILFCIEGNLMILLHAFIKKSQKTPEKEVEIGYKRLKEMRI